ncbi:MAG: MlaE family lipid ABC transporter permease subunit [Campylobacterota bacterium]|nr:MlaE family lipid ABC transporter permease subunit [Campylobacterota bacterium]
MIDFHPLQHNNENITIELIGLWDKNHLHEISTKTTQFTHKIKNKHLSLDFAKLEDIDSAGMIFVHHTIAQLKNQQCTISVENISDKVQKLYEFYHDKVHEQNIPLVSNANIFYRMGKQTIVLLKSSLNFLNFLGHTTFFFLYAVLHPAKIRYKAIVQQVQATGVNALGIIGLTVFLVGLVLAYQGAEQLQKFGANIFIVEMISMSLFRELAPMITAIVIAGRSASAFTAQIGTMKITEEIDAMRTMGFEPSIFLVMPRIIGLMIAMPLLVFVADFLGLAGGMVVAHYQLDISYAEFIHRMYLEVDIKHFIIGIAKAPVFGLIIALIGCYRGFQVSGSTASIGRFTTISVVNAIFWVIAINALISVLLTEIGL